jgi:hypothetical protein
VVSVTSPEIVLWARAIDGASGSTADIKIVSD